MIQTFERVVTQQDIRRGYLAALNAPPQHQGKQCYEIFMRLSQRIGVRETCCVKGKTRVEVNHFTLRVQRASLREPRCCRQDLLTGALPERRQACSSVSITHIRIAGRRPS